MVSITNTDIFFLIFSSKIKLVFYAKKSVTSETIPSAEQMLQKSLRGGLFYKYIHLKVFSFI